MVLGPLPHLRAAPSYALEHRAVFRCWATRGQLQLSHFSVSEEAMVPAVTRGKAQGGMATRNHGRLAQNSPGQSRVASDGFDLNGE